MGKRDDYVDTGNLEFESIQLDIKTLRRYKEVDRKEFMEFSTGVQKKNLVCKKHSRVYKTHSPSGQASVHSETPPAPHKLTLAVLSSTPICDNVRTFHSHTYFLC